MNQDFDEKQLIDRGIAFKWGFITALISIIGMFALTDIFELQITNYAQYLITFWIPCGITFIILILKDAYEAVNTRNGRIAILFFTFAAVILLMTSIAQNTIHEETLGLYADNEGMYIGKSSFGLGYC